MPEGLDHASFSSPNVTRHLSFCQTGFVARLTHGHTDSWRMIKLVHNATTTYRSRVHHPSSHHSLPQYKQNIVVRTWLNWSQLNQSRRAVWHSVIELWDLSRKAFGNVMGVHMHIIGCATGRIRYLTCGAMLGGVTWINITPIGNVDGRLSPLSAAAPPISRQRPFSIVCHHSLVEILSTLVVHWPGQNLRWQLKNYAERQFISDLKSETRTFFVLQLFGIPHSRSRQYPLWASWTARSSHHVSISVASLLHDRSRACPVPMATGVLCSQVYIHTCSFDPSVRQYSYMAVAASSDLFTQVFSHPVDNWFYQDVPSTLFLDFNVVRHRVKMLL